MRSNKYPSDVTDEQWALIEPLIPVYSGGRPRKTDLRDVVDAIFYLLRTSCQWAEQVEASFGRESFSGDEATPPGIIGQAGSKR